MTTNGTSTTHPRGRRGRRRRGRRLGLRRLGHRAAAGREGLPGARARGRAALRGRRLRQDLVGHASNYLWAPQAGLLRHPAHPPAARRRGARRRGRRRWVAELRQHPLRAAVAVLPATSSGPTSPTGRASSPRTTRRPAGCWAWSPTRATASVEELMQRTADDLGVGGVVPQDAGRGLLRCARRDGRRPLLRWRRARSAPAAPSAATAWSDAGWAPRTRCARTTSRSPRASGVTIEPMRTVTRLGVVPGTEGDDATYRVLHERTGPVAGRDVQVVTARQVVLAAGAWGTQTLLHEMKRGRRAARGCRTTSATAPAPTPRRCSGRWPSTCPPATPT